MFLRLAHIWLGLKWTQISLKKTYRSWITLMSRFAGFIFWKFCWSVSFSSFIIIIDKFCSAPYKNFYNRNNPYKKKPVSESLTAIPHHLISTHIPFPTSPNSGPIVPPSRHFPLNYNFGKEGVSRIAFGNRHRKSASFMRIEGVSSKYSYKYSHPLRYDIRKALEQIQY